jgi:2-iminoacetate synthase ThiH
MIDMRSDEFREMLENAAKAGATEALRELGLHDENAAEDVRALRGLLDAWRDARRTAWQTAIKMITTGALIAMTVGVTLHLKGDR